MRKLLACTLLISVTACSPAPPEVRVDGEVLVGKTVNDGETAAFLGIPFAEPPVGDLRWRAPQPLATKVGERRVTGFAPACMQSMRILDWYRYMAETFGGSADYYDDLEVSEDCLYLNIWTPSLDRGADLPVLVWVHGGSNNSGWSYEPNYHGYNLAERGVVVVSIAYRLGVFGFFSHPDLPRDEPVANFGLWDIVAALEWLERNIATFGGDPDRVTLFGESAGAQDILALMASDAAAGLFHRASLQSNAGYGLPGEIYGLGNEEWRARHLATHLGIQEDPLAGLRALPAETLLAEYEELFEDYYHNPAVDGQLIRRPTWEAISAGDLGGRELIIGTNRDEWLDFIAADADSDALRETIAGLSYIDPAVARRVTAGEQDVRRAMDRARTADQMLCPSQATARLASENGLSAWMYFFTRVREDAGGAALGAYHGAEYPYVFGVHDAYMTTNDTDLALTDAMQRYWVQFAATGDPNVDGLPAWPRYGAPGYRVQEFGDSVRTIASPERELCESFSAD
jgi:para-nitrobenzyl esterase